MNAIYCNGCPEPPAHVSVLAGGDVTGLWRYLIRGLESGWYWSTVVRPSVPVEAGDLWAEAIAKAAGPMTPAVFGQWSGVPMTDAEAERSVTMRRGLVWGLYPGAAFCRLPEQEFQRLRELNPIPGEQRFDRTPAWTPASLRDWTSRVRHNWTSSPPRPRFDELPPARPVMPVWGFQLASGHVVEGREDYGPIRSTTRRGLIVHATMSNGRVLEFGVVARPRVGLDLADAAEPSSAPATPPPLPPRVVTICGSMRFEDDMREAAVNESLAGRVVLAPMVNMKREDPRWSDDDSADLKLLLDALHLAKIDMADEVLLVAPGGYVGESTRRELDYARRQGKPVRTFPLAEPYVSDQPHTADVAADPGMGANA